MRANGYSFRLCKNKKVETARSPTELEMLLSSKNLQPNSIFLHDGKRWRLGNLSDMIGRTGDQTGTAQVVFISGDKGEDGRQGRRGISGPTGPLGPTGSQGIRGRAGPIGPIGPQGEQGVLGPRGMLGGFGSQGCTGSLGPTGPQGIPGPGFSSLIEDQKRVNLSICSTPAMTGVCTGNYNLFVGRESGDENTSGSGNTFLGHISGSSNMSGSWNTFVGTSAGNDNISGDSMTFVGSNAGDQTKDGNGCVCIGDSATTTGDNPTNQIVFGKNTTSYGNNTVTFPSNLRNLPSGTEVNFSSTSGGCLYPVSSSVRWKENVIDIEDTIDTSRIYDLRPVTFNPSLGHGNPEELHIGLIAEEVENIFPIIVPKDNLGRPASVRYSMLSVLILSELKKLRSELLEINGRLPKES